MKHPIINKILTEWAYRVHDGMPNPKNPMHLIHLRESLQYLKIDEEVIDLMMNRLYEQKFYARNPKGKQISVFTNKDNYEKAVKGGYEPVDREEAEKELGGQGEEPKTPDVGGDSEEKPKPPSKPKIVEPQDNPYDKKTDDEESEEIPKRMIGGKNKSLKSINSSEQEAFTKDLEPTGDSFKIRNQEHSIGEPPPSFKLPESLYQNNKFPGRYLNVISRMMNTKFSDETKKWSHFSDIEGGAGRISAQAGELMTMVGTAMSDEEFEEFTNALLQHEQQQIEAHPELKKEGTRIVTKSWIQSAANNRKAIRQRLLKQYGEGVEIVNTAWDVKDEFEALGNDNYETNKGFSSDMYIKIKTQDGTEILDEVSLKKSTKVNFLNSSTGKFEEWDEDVDDAINPKIYRQKQRERLINGVQNNLSQLKEVLDDKEYNKVVDALESKAGSRSKAKVLWKAMNKLADSGNAPSQSWVKDHKNAHIEYQKEAIRQITENDKLKSGMLKEIQSEFPLKAVSDGEETMAIGPYSLDKMTMKSIFGTSDYDEIKEKLVAKEPKPLFKNGEPVIDKKTGEQKMSPPYVGYQADIGGEIIPIAQIGIREDGVGYGGQIKFEMVLDPRFGKVLGKAHSDVYGEE